MIESVSDINSLINRLIAEALILIFHCVFKSSIECLEENGKSLTLHPPAIKTNSRLTVSSWTDCAVKSEGK